MMGMDGADEGAVNVSAEPRSLEEALRAFAEAHGIRL